MIYYDKEINKQLKKIAKAMEENSKVAIPIFEKRDLPMATYFLLQKILLQLAYISTQLKQGKSNDKSK